MLLLKLARRFTQKLHQISWMTLGLSTVVLFVWCWILLWLTEPAEAEIVQPDTFWWFFVVTATTVGYGDFSPSSELGRLSTAVFNMGGGISLLGAVIGKAASDVTTLLRRNMQGKGDHSALTGHIVLFGWRGERSRAIVEMIYADTSETRQLVICSTRAGEHPIPEMNDRVKFVRGERLGDTDVLHRAGTPTAGRIVIDGHDDDQTLATALAVLKAAPSSCHIAAYFDGQTHADLLEAHAPAVETIVTVSAEQLVRAIQDPGSSQVTRQLLTASAGATQYAMTIPAHAPGLRWTNLLRALHLKMEATPIAVAPAGQEARIRLSPPGETQIEPGDVIYYLCDRRLDPAQIDWTRLT